MSKNKKGKSGLAKVAGGIFLCVGVAWEVIKAISNTKKYD